MPSKSSWASGRERRLSLPKVFLRRGIEKGMQHKAQREGARGELVEPHHQAMPRRPPIGRQRPVRMNCASSTA